MARPRTLKYKTGEIVFRNLAKEDTDELMAKLLVGNSDTDTSVEETTVKESVVEQMSVSDELQETALSLLKNKDGVFEIVTVKYNKETREAQVADIQNCGKERAIATSDFKIKVANLFL